MPNKRNPRRGSMQYWPRKRANRAFARVRSHVRGDSKNASLAGFAGYKVGMTHIIVNDKSKNSLTKGMNVSMPATIIECPPLKVVGVRFYKERADNLPGSEVVGTIMSVPDDKNIDRTLHITKKPVGSFDNVPEYDEMRVIVHTLPARTGIGKKKPEVFEMVFSGSKEDQLAYAKEKLGKEISLAEAVEAGAVVDVHGVTTGKGTQGPVKRFGVKVRSAKSEKTKRAPGSIAGGWKAQGHMMYRTAHTGKMGYHQRKEYNKWVLKISDDPKEVNPAGGFVRYGVVKSSYMLLKGSIPGPAKRLIRMSPSVRPHNKIPKEAPDIKEISLVSRQR